MIDINGLIYSKLKEIGLPVMPEIFLSATTNLPVITYLEYSNRDYIVGDTMEYSELIQMIKVWSTDLGELMSNAILIDAKMRPLGFKRDFGSPLFSDGIGQYILRYKATGFNKIEGVI